MKCDSYLSFVEVGAGGVAENAPSWVGGEVLVVDLDRDGNPVGIEFFDRLPCPLGVAVSQLSLCAQSKPVTAEVAACATTWRSCSRSSSGSRPPAA